MDFECQECGAEFDLISEDDMLPKYCPYCGEQLQLEEEEPDEDMEYDDE